MQAHQRGISLPCSTHSKIIFGESCVLLRELTTSSIKYFKYSNFFVHESSNLQAKLVQIEKMVADRIDSAKIDEIFSNPFSSGSYDIDVHCHLQSFTIFRLNSEVRVD
jgi:hypothetical protein